jgi:hypothetical protein
MMDFLTFLFWFASVSSLIGAYFVGEHNRIGFLFWIYSNPILLYSAYTTSSYYNVVMFAVFWILALRGYTKKSKPLLIVDKDYSLAGKSKDDFMNKQEFMDWLEEKKIR